MNGENPSPAGDELSIERVLEGDRAAWGEVLERSRSRLRNLVALRIDPRLLARVDPSDVVQEALVSATLRLPEYRQRPAVPLYVWLRQLTLQQMAILHRRHLGVQLRDARREISLSGGAWPRASSAALAALLLCRQPGPEEALLQAERTLRVEAALERMDPIDREALALRHFEQLTTVEMAQVLEISEAAASKRYLRALKKMRVALGGRELG